MKLPNEHTKHTKWGLFLLLTGTLGFTISMNPNHFNQTAQQFALSESVMHQTDMAETFTVAQRDTLATPAEIAAETKAATAAATIASEAKTAAPAATVAAPVAAAPTPAATTPAVAPTATAVAPAATATASPIPAALTNSVSAADPNLKERVLPFYSSNGKSFEVTFMQLKNETYASFRSLSPIAQGTTCTVCEAGLMRLKSGYDKTDDLTAEVGAILAGKAELKDTSAKVEAKDFDIDEWAKKCEGDDKKQKDDSEEKKLACHKTRLLELSKTLKNNSDQAATVLSYYDKFIAQGLRAVLLGKTVRETRAESCEGNVVYQSTFGRVGCEMREAFDAANELTEELIKGLSNSQNGKTTVQALLKLQAGSFSEQYRNSQNLAKQAQTEGNAEKSQFAMANLDTNTEQLLLNERNDLFTTDISSSSLSKAQKSSLLDSLDRSFYTPVSTMLSQMRAFINPNPQDPNARNRSHNPLDFKIPNLAGGSSSSIVDGSNSRGTGEPGNTDLYSHRAGIARGGDLPALGTMWGNQGANRYNPNLPSSSLFPTAQPNPFGAQVNGFNSNIFNSTPSSDPFGRTANRAR